MLSHTGWPNGVNNSVLIGTRLPNINFIQYFNGYPPILLRLIIKRYKEKPILKKFLVRRLWSFILDVRGGHDFIRG